jgi:hypothetical protein
MTKDNKNNKKQCDIHVINTRYLCECGWKGTTEEMKREYDSGYDQSCCPECNDVLINNLNWEVYCNIYQQQNKVN